MSSWNSIPLEISYQVLGWIAFFSWSFSFYPQAVLNFRRKSVVGLNFDFLVLNLTKHSSYLIYNAVLFFSPTVQKQYHEKYGFNENAWEQIIRFAINTYGNFASVLLRDSDRVVCALQMIPVAPNDVAFSIHAVLLTGITLIQVLIYDRGSQRVSRTCIAISCVVWISASVCVFVALPSQSWLWLISVFNTIQVFMTVIKYIPQAIMNFSRKSTVGWSIGNILLDLLGGVTNYGQMAMQSIDQGSWVNFYGNIGKTLLSLVSIFFDLLFIVQHYLLYPSKKEKVSPEADEESTAPLIKSSQPLQSENV
ncbi:hypothetical protein IFM89_023122 [Coptis chinensis]|uniref:Cystinosin homolog n=1 Tax=Coptis chinensis TaxID=261450 RepID=A0A835LWT2_9MAGN|nr:hypothetical protein IFM89_023122 [Coptis chinensis]